MSYRVFATDFDGTIAHDGVVDEPTLVALRQLKASGVKIVLVSGRELPDFLNVFPEVDLFDLLVLENGAILYDPAAKKMELLAPSPPEPFVQRLREQNIPLSIGHSVVATVEPHEHAVLDAIREFQIEWHVIFNKGAVMCLPAGITKATGLKPALERLGIAASETVAAGDAENDHAMLRMVGLAVAPANALQAIKDEADLVTDGARGDGVQELIARWLLNGLADIEPNAKRPKEPAMA